MLDNIPIAYQFAAGAVLLVGGLYIQSLPTDKFKALLAKINPFGNTPSPSTSIAEAQDHALKLVDFFRSKNDEKGVALAVTTGQRIFESFLTEGAK